MFNARNQIRWFEEEWRRNNEREVEKIEEPVVAKVSEPVVAEVEKMEEEVVEVGAVKEVGLSKGAKPP
jgi:hypothetical protein